MDKKFGSDYNSLIERSHNFESMIFIGMDKMENITGYKGFCNKIRYKLNLVHSVPIKVYINTRSMFYKKHLQETLVYFPGRIRNKN